MLDLVYDMATCMSSGFTDVGEGFARPETTENGARCLAHTGNANLDLFSAPVILFDGTGVAPDAAEGVRLLYTMLEAAYREDRGLAVSNILFLGNIREAGKRNHPAYMVALAWMVQEHPRTFMAAVAPVMAANACERDLLTLFAVVTRNTSFPLKRLWEGEQCDASNTSKRATLRAEEKRLWKSLLRDEFPGLKASDVVHAEPLRRSRKPSAPPAPEADAESCSPVPPLRRESVYVVDVVDLDETEHTDPIPNADCGGYGAMRSSKRNYPSFHPFKKKNKNVWSASPTGVAFKTRWHAIRAQLHRRDYGAVSSVVCSNLVYRELADFVVNWFARRLTEGNLSSAKWAPTADGAIDKATKGVRAFDLPPAWGQTGGISQAIAFKLFKTSSSIARMEDACPPPSNEQLVRLHKRQVMAAYKKHVSGLRAAWVPEHLVGNPATVDCVPDFKKATALWMANTAPRVLKTDEQKKRHKAFLSDVERGVKGCTATSGGQKPYVLFEACCAPKPDPAGETYTDEDGSDAVEECGPQEGDEDAPGGGDTPTVAAWRSQRKVAHLQFQDMVKKLATLLDKTGVVAVPVSDTSGSMQGVPMRVSVALGALLAMANTDPAYHNKVLSFEEECTVTTLDTTSCRDPDATERSVREQMGELPWGGSSNLESVFQKVAELERERLAATPVSKKLVVIVFTDMEVHPRRLVLSCYINTLDGSMSTEINYQSKSSIMNKPGSVQRFVCTFHSVDTSSTINHLEFSDGYEATARSITNHITQKLA
jgi:hypothetical protein